MSSVEITTARTDDLASSVFAADLDEDTDVLSAASTEIAGYEPFDVGKPPRPGQVRR